MIDLKIVEVKKQFKQVTDIQTAIDVQFGDKSPFHLKVKELQSEISDIPRASGESPQLKRKFDEAQKTLKTCANFRPRTGGFFIRLFLGQVNVVEFSSTAKQMLKSEYLKFRDRTTIIFIIWPLLLMYCPAELNLDLLWHIWLLYYYLSIALRENILKANGSEIHGWWFMHHYISMAMSCTNITWPSTSSTRLFYRHHFYRFALLQGSVQLLQNYYWNKRNYTAVTLGKANSMTVVPNLYGETLLLRLLVLVLVCVQTFQIYLGYTFLSGSLSSGVWSEGTGELQCFGVGAMNMVMGFGNVSTTIQSTKGRLLGQHASKRKEQ